MTANREQRDGNVEDPGKEGLDILQALVVDAEDADNTSTVKKAIGELMGDDDKLNALAEAQIEYPNKVSGQIAVVGARHGLAAAVDKLAKVVKDRAKQLQTSRDCAARDAARAAHKAAVEEGSANPIIYVNTDQERAVVDQAADAMVAANTPPRLFRRGDLLVRLEGQDQGSRFCELTRSGLADELSRAADWYALKDDGAVNARQPEYVAQRLHDSPDPRLPDLLLHATVPVFDPGGALLATNGYHPASGTYLSLPAELDRQWPTDVTENQVQAAVELIRDDWLADFVFAEEGDFAHFLAFLIQPLVMAMIEGTTPALLITAPVRGVGKTFLAQLLGRVHIGGSPAVCALPKTEEEQEKRITTYLVDGHPIVVFDNVDKGLSSSVLALLLTGEVWKSRILGVTRSVTVPNRTTWIFTGQNPMATDELVRRFVEVSILPSCEKPEKRNPSTFRHPNIHRWTESNRARLLEALITLVLWWKQQGCPPGKGSMGSYEDWVRVVGGIVQAAGVPGFLDKKRSSLEHRQYVDVVKELVRAWALECPQEAMTSKELLAFGLEHADVELHEDLTAQKLGQRLGTKRGVIVQGYRLESGGQNRRRVSTWVLEPVTPREPERVSHPPREDGDQPEETASAGAQCQAGQAPAQPRQQPRHAERPSYANNERSAGAAGAVSQSKRGSERKTYKSSTEEVFTHQYATRAADHDQAPAAPAPSAYPYFEYAESLQGLAPELTRGLAEAPAAPAGDQDDSATSEPDCRSVTPLPSAYTEVSNVRDQALALGWTEDQLTSTTGATAFPSPGHGLVCHLRDGDTLGAVTRQSIEILHPNGHRARFYNDRAPQPWVSKKNGGSP